MALVKRDDIAGTGWFKLPDWMKGMLPEGAKITATSDPELDMHEYGVAASYAAHTTAGTGYGDVITPLKPAEVAEQLLPHANFDAADEWLNEHDRGERQFTVTEVLTREVTLTFTGEIVPSGDLLAGWEHITSEARLDGAEGSVVATTDFDGHIVLYFSSEDKYGD